MWFRQFLIGSVGFREPQGVLLVLVRPWDPWTAVYWPRSQHKAIGALCWQDSSEEDTSLPPPPTPPPGQDTGPEMSLTEQNTES